MKYDYIVIGGGIIGMTTAREIANRGASVAILDRQSFGNEASRVAGGILSPMRPWIENKDSIALSEKSKKLYTNFIHELKNETGIDSQLIRSGLIITNKAHSQETIIWAKKNKIELIEKINIHYPKLNIPNHSILLPEIFQVRPTLLLNALYKSLQNLQVKLLENSIISHIQIDKNEFKYITLSNHKKIYSNNLIITAGAWSKLVLKSINNEVNIKPIRGQIINLRSNKSIIDKIILDGAYYLIPRHDNNILIGSTMEDVGFINKTTDLAKDQLLQWGYSIIPQLIETKLVSHSAGLRPAASDGKPLIGLVTNFKNIYINSGHFRKGILQAPASAKLLADHLFGEPSFMDIHNFSLEYRNNTKKIA